MLASKINEKKDYLNKVNKLKKEIIQTQKNTKNMENLNVQMHEDIQKLNHVLNNKGEKNFQN